jgi:hypothetical protein
VSGNVIRGRSGEWELRRGHPPRQSVRVASDDGIPIPWDELRRAFSVDGGLRDIYVFDATVDVWQNALDWLLHLGASGAVRLEPQPEALPRDAGAILDMQGSGDPRLRIYAGGVQINCHFFDRTEIEFDIDPREIDGPARARIVTDFMQGLATATGRAVHLTDENSPEAGWVSFDPTTHRWTLASPNPLTS